MDNLLKWVYYISIAASLIISFLGMAGVFPAFGLAWSIALVCFIVAFITLLVRCYRYMRQKSE